MARTFFSLDVDAVVPIAQVRAHPERAFLFIQCEGDTTVAPHHGTEMKAASANAATELWMVPGCGHVRAFVTHPAEWEARVTAFLEGQLGRQRGGGASRKPCPPNPVDGGVITRSTEDRNACSAPWSAWCPWVRLSEEARDVL